jgi:predicted nucleic acid-binding protein
LSKGWLLDTNVVSELVKGPRANDAVVRWIDEADPDRLYLSVITIGELTKGIGLAEARGLDMNLQRSFVDELLARFGPRILPFDTKAALAWGRLLARLRGSREDERILAVDAQIAAIAETEALQICSRNVRDFARLGVSSVVDPFTA